MYTEHRPPRIRALVFALVLALLVTACAPAAPQGAAPEAAAPEASASSVATISFTQEPDSLNPLYTTMWFSGILTDIYLVGLWNFNDAVEPTLQLARELPSAENGGISEDGRVITVHLREDAAWSDGEPVTAADFIFTYEMIMDDRNMVLTRAPYDPYVESIVADGDYTLVITFKEPYAPWVSSIFNYVLPKHILAPVMEAEGTIDNAEWNRNPTVGVGPYVFTEWESGSHILFSRNENHWQQANIDRIFVRMTPDDAAQVAAIKAGDSDIGVYLSFADVPGLQELGTVSIIPTPSGFMEGFFFNVGENGHPALKDVKVRQALAYAFNRDQINQDLLLGLTGTPASPWDLSPFASPDVQPWPYDPEMAVQLLDEAGWVVGADGIREKDGVKLNLRYATNMRDVRLDTQVVAQDMFREVGIGVELINHPSDVFFAAYSAGGPIASGEYDIASWSSQPNAYPDPDTARWTCREIPSAENPVGDNWSYYCNPQLDELFDLQARTVDLDERIAIYGQIKQMMLDEMIWLGVWQDNDMYSVSSRLEGVRISGVDPFWNIADWMIK
ncbi:MAG: peptide ABC transporter substrate-binding protein [Chloroflexota bacterium]|nr:peptide ABC transporter substrate-binding protein [Chloroflexota bacterium]